MVLADPEPVGLGLGLGVVGGEVTDALDWGEEEGLGGGLDVRVSGGDAVFPLFPVGPLLEKTVV